MLRDEVKSKVRTLKLHNAGSIQNDRSMNSIVQHPKLLFSWILFLYNIGVYYMYQFLKKQYKQQYAKQGDYFLTLTNDGGEKIVFLCGVKTDQIHASVPAEIATIKPIPVFKFVPRFPPRQEIIMAAPLHVRNSCSRKQTLAK